MNQEVRACVFCQHADYEEPYAYESCSGGDAWSCMKGHFGPYSGTIDMIDECAYERALNCKDFELACRFKKESE